jgi:hypothetical protein
MLILGWLTIRNVRQGQHLRREMKDRQLTAMLFIQVICFIILSFLISIQKTFTNLTLYRNETIRKFFRNICGFMNIIK